MSEHQEIYVALLDECIDVFRPVQAEPVGPMIYRLIGPVPTDEKWEFQPGELVRCEERAFADGKRGILAIAAFGS